MTTWGPDVLGDGYKQLTLSLGPDPDGEGDAFATLVRYEPESTAVTATPRPAVLYVHGFTDYFFQRHIAEHFHRRGYRFYALDLRKCGRSLREGQTPHFITDLETYDAELDRALEVVRDETPGKQVLLAGHSTGGLILPLWLDRLNRLAGGASGAGISGLVLNSPWFDLQGPPLIRTVGTVVIDVVGRLRPSTPVPAQGIDTYGLSIRDDWEYDLAWKPVTGFPVTFGWIRAIRHGHARLHRGLDIGVPALVLRSKMTRFSKTYVPEVDNADAVLDVRQIARWAGCLGDRTTVIPIEGARHDVFLSRKEPLALAFSELDNWLDWHETLTPSVGGDHAEIVATT